MAIVGQGTKIIIFNAGGYSATNKRYDFTEAAKSIPKSAGEDLCHYISFDYIKSTLVAAANKFYRGEHDYNTFLQNIRLLCEAVKTGEHKVNTPAMNAVYTNIDMAVAALESVSDNTQDMSDTLNTLLYNLNSADTNLRPGDSRWNRSIGGEYDPYGWVHFNAEGKIDNTNLNLSNDNKADIEGRKHNNSCFYLANDIDCIKYALLDSLKDIVLPSILSAKYEGKELLYSSANYIFDFSPDSNDYYKCNDNVYYFEVEV